MLKRLAVVASAKSAGLSALRVRIPLLLPDKTMNEKLTKFVTSQSNNLGRELFDMHEKETEARAAMQAIAWDRRKLYHQSKTFLEMLQENPDMAKAEGFDSNSVYSAQHFVHEYEKEEKENPVDRLLNWSSGYGKESFVLSQVYDLIGKDDARTFRALLREVVLLADPTRAGDV